MKNWIIATRPWALPASVMPILIMWAYLYSQSDNGAAHINWLNALLCLPLLSIVHSGGNMVSDYFDFTWGVDTKACSNGVTWYTTARSAQKRSCAMVWCSWRWPCPSACFCSTTRRGRDGGSDWRASCSRWSIPG